VATEIQRRAQDELQRREETRDQVKKSALPTPGQSEIAELITLTNKEKPDPKDIEQLRQYLGNHPEEVALVGNLANQVEGQLISTALRFSGFLATATGEYCTKMRADMGYQAASALEKGLIDHVVICWLRLHICEFQYEQYTKGATLTVAAFWEDTLSATQKRYLRSIETLARVRRLLKEPKSPVLNMLLAQQINNRG
jgi:hypothetical protein